MRFIQSFLKLSLSPIKQILSWAIPGLVLALYDVDGILFLLFLNYLCFGKVIGNFASSLIIGIFGLLWVGAVV